ncbi:helix-turn-helix protein [Roseateles depolymerans]|uniref:XRE family transcriptional regulator n=2 Tax=Roseateles depolymerans TaxID=76731 RepID=A0A0U2U271_9BURK|nr:XRE family transcriptional regulator [Roseateles depolymerans]REG19373.1 helix-turn-helix protein [Roseateles depolymerans]
MADDFPILPLSPAAPAASASRKAMAASSDVPAQAQEGTARAINPLGQYLKDCRTRLDAQALGYSTQRRRTAGLRREEVALRAHISPTWYTWLEQGRGGAPSAEVLHRIATALMLTEVEREHLFLLGLGRAPEVTYRGAADATPRLQRILDALGFCPALVKTPTWQVVAWNRAASLVLRDYGSLAPRDRNILRLMFLEPAVREAQADWAAAARFVVAAFRADLARAGAMEEAKPLITELTQRSPEFAAMWRDNSVRSYGEGTKQLRHAVVGPLQFEYSSLTIDGRPDLAMVVFHPLTAQDRDKIHQLMASAPGSSEAAVAEAAAAAAAAT